MEEAGDAGDHLQGKDVLGSMELWDNEDQHAEVAGNFMHFHEQETVLGRDLDVPPHTVDRDWLGNALGALAHGMARTEGAHPSRPSDETVAQLASIERVFGGNPAKGDPVLRVSDAYIPKRGGGSELKPPTSAVQQAKSYWRERTARAAEAQKAGKKPAEPATDPDDPMAPREPVGEAQGETAAVRRRWIDTPARRRDPRYWRDVLAEQGAFRQPLPRDWEARLGDQGGRCAYNRWRSIRGRGPAGGMQEDLTSPDAPGAAFRARRGQRDAPGAEEGLTSKSDLGPEGVLLEAYDTLGIAPPRASKDPVAREGGAPALTRVADAVRQGVRQSWPHGSLTLAEADDCAQRANAPRRFEQLVDSPVGAPVFVAQIVQRAVLLAVARLHGVPAFALQAQRSVAEQRAVEEAARLSDAVVQELVEFDVFDELVEQGRVPHDDENYDGPNNVFERIARDNEHEELARVQEELGVEDSELDAPDERRKFGADSASGSEAAKGAAGDATAGVNADRLQAEAARLRAAFKSAGEELSESDALRMAKELASKSAKARGALKDVSLGRHLEAREAVATRRAKERLRALNLSGGKADLLPLGESMREIRVRDGETPSQPDAAVDPADVELSEELRLQREAAVQSAQDAEMAQELLLEEADELLVRLSGAHDEQAVADGRSADMELETESIEAAGAMLDRPHLQPTWIGDVVADRSEDAMFESGWGQAIMGVSEDLYGAIQTGHVLGDGADGPMGGMGDFYLNSQFRMGQPAGYNPGAAWGDWLAYTRNGGAENVPGPRPHYGPAKSNNPYWQPGTVDPVFNLGLARMPDGVKTDIEDPAVIERYAREGKEPAQALEGVDVMLQKAADLAGPAGLDSAGGLDHVFELGEVPREQVKAAMPQSGAGQKRAAAMEDASVTLELPPELAGEKAEVDGEGAEVAVGEGEGIGDASVAAPAESTDPAVDAEATSSESGASSVSQSDVEEAALSDSEGPSLEEASGDGVSLLGGEGSGLRSRMVGEEGQEDLQEAIDEHVPLDGQERQRLVVDLVNHQVQQAAAPVPPPDTSNMVLDPKNAATLPMVWGGPGIGWVRPGFGELFLGDGLSAETISPTDHGVIQSTIEAKSRQARPDYASLASAFGTPQLAEEAAASANQSAADAPDDALLAFARLPVEVAGGTLAGTPLAEHVAEDGSVSS